MVRPRPAQASTAPTRSAQVRCLLAHDREVGAVLEGPRPQVQFPVTARTGPGQGRRQGQALRVGPSPLSSTTDMAFRPRRSPSAERGLRVGLATDWWGCPVPPCRTPASPCKPRTAPARKIVSPALCSGAKKLAGSGAGSRRNGAIASCNKRRPSCCCTDVAGRFARGWARHPCVCLARLSLRPVHLSPRRAPGPGSAPRRRRAAGLGRTPPHRRAGNSWLC